MGAPTLNHYLVLGALLFAIAIVGIFLNRKNVIILLMAIELMLLAVNMNFVAFSYFLGDISGQVGGRTITSPQVMSVRCRHHQRSNRSSRDRRYGRC